MKFYDARNLKKSNLRSVANITEMVQSSYYDDPPDLEQAVNAIFHVLSDEQRIKVAQRLGYITEDKYLKYLKIKYFVESLKRKFKHGFLNLEFSKDRISIENEMTDSEVNILQDLPEVERVEKIQVRDYDYEDDKYYIILKDCDLKKDIETCLDSGISLEF